MSSDRSSIETKVTSRIALDPADWAVATWRPRQPLLHSSPAPFKRGVCLTRLRRFLQAQANFGYLEWSRANFPDLLSPEEGHFWFLAITDSSREFPQGRLVADLECIPLNGQVSHDEVRARLRRCRVYPSPQLLIPLRSLFSPLALLQILLDEELCTIDPYSVPYHYVVGMQSNLIEGFRRYVLPFLDESTLEELRQLARARLPASMWSQSVAPTFEQSLGYRLAPLLGMHREMASVVASWPNTLFPARGGYEEFRRCPREIIFGLGDPWLVEQHTRRLKLSLRTETEARAWLAHTETAALDVMVGSCRSLGCHSSAVLDALCLVQSPAVVRPLLELRLEGHSSPNLKAWFDRQIGNGVAGTLPLIGGRGKVAEAARQYLRDVKRRGLASIIEEHLGQVDPAIANRVRITILDIEESKYPLIDNQTMPGWLAQLFAHLPMGSPELPAWLVIEDLPPLVIDGRCLGGMRLRFLLRALAACSLKAEPSLFSAFRKHIDANGRELFVWRLIDQWLFAGAPAHDAWALNVAGFLGDDESVLKLATLIRDSKNWPGRSRAQQALDCLAAIGSSLAYQQLSSFARQARSRLVRDRARTLVHELAERRGQSRTELDDVAVPTLGFDGEQGPMFDYGSRQFQAVLAPGGRLLLRDPAGNIREDLPAPGVRDDRQRAQQAIVEWRLLRKSLREVNKEQSARLERAMVSGQRWSLRHFRERILVQPILRPLVRLLLWAGYDERGHLIRTFRLTDDDTFVDMHEQIVSVTNLNSVRVVHPIELDATLRDTWADVWRDHELIPPFPQLGRRLFVLSPQERHETALTAFQGRHVPALTISGLVRHHEWVPTLIGEANPGEAHEKGFRNWDLTAVVYHPYVGSRYPHHSAVQELQAAHFFHGAKANLNGFDPRSAIPLCEVHDLARSEVCELLAALHARGRD